MTRKEGTKISDKKTTVSESASVREKTAAQSTHKVKRAVYIRIGQ
jgi:hypothetical protein